MSVTDTLVAGRYRIIRALGAGGMGRVWLARDELLCRDVAIKEIMLPFGLAEDEREELRLRTLREARAAARLSHPNVVQIYDVQSGDEQPWIVMEYVRSRSLLQVIKENGPLPVEAVAGIGLAMLSALDAANRVGVLHRDVKPSNVLIADDGRVVLTDFGSAMIDEGEGALTRTGVILGSPLFIAPERVDKGVSTPEADLWSLGATLYAAVEGRPPYTRTTTLRSLIAVTTDRPDPTHLAGPLKAVLVGLLQRNPQARMKAAEAEQRLRRLADVQTTVHLRHIPKQRTAEPAAPAVTATPAGPPPQPAPYELGAATTARQAADLAGAATTGHAEELAAAMTARQGRQQSADVQLINGDRPAAGGLVRAAHPYRPVPGVAPRRWRVLAASAVAAIVLPLAAMAGSTDHLRSSGSEDAKPAQAKLALPGAGAVATTSRPPASSPAAVRPPVLFPAISTAGFERPATFRWWRDSSGYEFTYPETYSRQREAADLMFFCAPGGPPTIRVRVWADAGPDLAAALQREERKAKLPRYQRIRVEKMPQETDGSAVWEYTFTDPKAGQLHGLERAFVAGGRTYLVQWRTPAKKWAAEQRTYTVVMNSFRPA